MNSEPHTHEVQVRYGGDPSMLHYFIKYGDTEVLVSKNPLFRKTRLRSGIRRAIRRHDYGSQPSAMPTEAAAQKVLAELPELPADRWASELV